MKYLITAALFVGFLIVVVLADIYEATKNAAWEDKQDVYAESLRNRAAYLGIASAGEYISPKWPRAYMPRAPEGWERRGWTLEDRQQLAGFIGPVEERKSQLAVMGPATPKKKEYDTFALDLRRPTNWVYEGPNGAYVQMAAYRAKDDLKGVTSGYKGAIVELTAPAEDPFAIRQPYTIERGVTWYLVMPDPDLVNATLPDWHLEADMGDMTFYLRGFLDEGTLRYFLGNVDYDAINAMQDVPVDGVGRRAPLLSDAEKQRQMEEDVARQIRANMALASAGGGKGALDAGLGGGADGNPVSVLSGIPGANQAITLNLEHKFTKIGMHDREASGDLTVWTPAELQARVAQLDQGDRNAFRMYANNFASSFGLTVRQASIDYDGNTDAAQKEAEEFAEGALPKTHPAYSLRAHEAKIGYPAGSCLLLMSRNIVCGTIAERLRIAKIVAGSGNRGGVFGQRDAGLSPAGGTRFGNLGNAGGGQRKTVSIAPSTVQSVGSQVAGVISDTGTALAGAVTGGVTMGAGKPAGSPAAQAAAMSDKAQEDHILKVAMTLMRMGLSPNDLTIAYDSQGPGAEQDAVLFAKGVLPHDAQGFAVHAAVLDGGHTVKGCLQLKAGTILCGSDARDLRVALEIKRLRAVAAAPVTPVNTAAPVSAPAAPNPRAEVRVNRLPTASGGAAGARTVGSRSGSCGGGTNFCRVGN